MVLGLKVLPDVEWIEIDSAFASDLAEKRRLLETSPDAVFRMMPGSEPAQQEFIDHLGRHLLAHHADRFTGTPGQVHVRDTGLDVIPDPTAPLRAAAALVQEDVLLLQRGAEAFHLVAGLLAFPTRWSLAEKMGQPLSAIHAPVPGYDTHLARPMDRLFDRLTSGRLLWRTNWSLLDDAALHQPGGHGLGQAGAALTPDTIGDHLWFRVERQTLSLLPETATAVFTVRIHQATLADQVKSPTQAQDLLSAIHQMPDAMRRYKSMPGFLPALQSWLSTRADGPSSG